MKKFSITVALVIAISCMWSCSKSEPPKVRSTNAYHEAPFALERLDGLRVKELLVVVFDHDYEVSQWKRIFDQTRELSANKRKLRSFEGSIDSAIDQIRGDLIARNADLLTDLGDQSLFIMSWSANDENCRFRELQLLCKPKSLENPLNGGLPVPEGDVQWIEPNPATSDTKSPYLRLILNHYEQPLYSLELRLKPELESDQEIWFKGEAVPLEGSNFKNAEGNLRVPKFPYGYAEISLGK